MCWASRQVDEAEFEQESREHELQSLRAENSHLKEKCEALRGHVLVLERQLYLNEKPITNYSGLLTAFEREAHKAEVKKSRAKLDALGE